MKVDILIIVTLKAWLSIFSLPGVVHHMPLWYEISIFRVSLHLRMKYLEESAGVLTYKDIRENDLIRNVI